MRKIVAGLLTSLDGVVESPGEWGFSHYFSTALGNGVLGVTYQPIGA